MIYVKFYSKTKDCFLDGINRKPSAEIEKMINIPDADIIQIRLFGLQNGWTKIA